MFSQVIQYQSDNKLYNDQYDYYIAHKHTFEALIIITGVYPWNTNQQPDTDLRKRIQKRIEQIRTNESLNEYIVYPVGIPYEIENGSQHFKIKESSNKSNSVVEYQSQRKSLVKLKMKLPTSFKSILVTESHVFVAQSHKLMVFIYGLLVIALKVLRKQSKQEKYFSLMIQFYLLQMKEQNLCLQVDINMILQMYQIIQVSYMQKIVIQQIQIGIVFLNLLFLFLNHQHLKDLSQLILSQQ